MPNPGAKNFDSVGGFFGSALDHEAPIVVCDCLAYIRNKGKLFIKIYIVGLYTEGIFRVPGEKGYITEIEKEYNKYYSSPRHKKKKNISVLDTLPREPSVHDVCGLLKSFFQSLPSPLMPFQATNECVRILNATSFARQEKIDELGLVIKRIKRPNRECLGFLISFLREVCTFKRFNQMSADNLATCFVLCLMSSNNSDAGEQMFLIANGARVLKWLISEPVNLFMPSVNSVKQNTLYVAKKDDDDDI
eukprot:maker-scaffold_20-snap-gene-2.9-mRNA-1 protein AED:0.04 eAED:0.04 QI:102/1/0.8/1/1/1/5/130/247